MMKQEKAARASLKSPGKTGTVKIFQFCLILALATFSTVASAGMIASDDFHGYNVGVLAGNNGGSGWSGAWVTTAPVVVTVVDPSTDLQGNRAIAFAGNNDAAASRSLSQTLSGDILIDFLIQFSGTVGDNDFLGLYFGSSFTGPNIGLKGNYGTGSDTEDFFVRTGGTSGSFLSGSEITSGTTYHLFGHLYKAPENNTYYNRFDAWLNPTSAEMMSLTGWDARFSGNSTITSIDKIGFRTANIDSGDTVLIDQLSISSVPEPSTVLLMVFGLVGLAGVARKKMN